VSTTADSLITEILEECHWPSADGDAKLGYSEILRCADKVIEGEYYPTVYSIDEEYYSATLDYAVTAAQQLYRQPSRSMGPLSDIVLVDADGNETSIDMITSRELASRSYQADQPVSTPSGYYFFFRADFVGLFPTPSSTDGTTLRIRYPRQPSALTLLANVTTVSSIALVATNILGVADDMSSAWSNGTQLDVVNAGNSYAPLAADYDGASVVSSAITFTETMSGLGIAVGDYVALTGVTPLVPLPRNMHASLIRSVALRCLRRAGEFSEASELEQEHRRLLDKATDAAKPRGLAEPKIVRASNSPLRSIINRSRW